MFSLLENAYVSLIVYCQFVFFWNVCTIFFNTWASALSQKFRGKSIELLRDASRVSANFILKSVRMSISDFKLCTTKVQMKNTHANTSQESNAKIKSGFRLDFYQWNILVVSMSDTCILLRNHDRKFLKVQTHVRNKTCSNLGKKFMICGSFLGRIQLRILSDCSVAECGTMQRNAAAASPVQWCWQRAFVLEYFFLFFWNLPSWIKVRVLNW